MLTYLQYHKVGEVLSFMNNTNREIEGIVDTVHIEIDKYQKRIWYEVEVDGELLPVDGETFRQIYK